MIYLKNSTSKKNSTSSVWWTTNNHHWALVSYHSTRSVHQACGGQRTIITERISYHSTRRQVGTKIVSLTGSRSLFGKRFSHLKIDLYISPNFYGAWRISFFLNPFYNLNESTPFKKMWPGQHVVVQNIFKQFEILD